LAISFFLGRNSKNKNNSGLELTSEYHLTKFGQNRIKNQGWGHFWNFFVKDPPTRTPSWPTHVTPISRSTWP
jgi:hypothetical protein